MSTTYPTHRAAKAPHHVPTAVMSVPNWAAPLEVADPK